jgi:hypothetical protein
VLLANSQIDSLAKFTCTLQSMRQLLWSTD